MKILVACEESQEVTKAFRAKGHEAYSCDIQECSGGHPEWHILEDVALLLYPLKFYTQDRKEHFVSEWDIIIAHPPCTYLCNSGVRYLYEDCRTGTAEDRWLKMNEAVNFFNMFLNHPCDKIAIENPVPHGHAKLPKFTQSIQPWQFGETEKKRTCFWLKGLPSLTPTDIVPESQRTDNIHRMGWSKGGIIRSKLRSKTFPGIAKAMADQWG